MDRPEDLKRPRVDRPPRRDPLAAACRRSWDVVYNHFRAGGKLPPHAYAPDFFDESIHTPWGGGDRLLPAAGAPVLSSWENALYWLGEFRFDGLRFDAVHAIRGMASEPHMGFTDRRSPASCGPNWAPAGTSILVLENDAN